MGHRPTARNAESSEEPVRRLRREYEAIFDPAIDDAERRRRREAWVADLRAAWPNLTPDEQWEMAERRSTMHLLHM